MVCLSVSFAKTNPWGQRSLSTAFTTLQPLSAPLKKPHPLALAKPEMTVTSWDSKSESLDEAASEFQIHRNSGVLVVTIILSY